MLVTFLRLFLDEMSTFVLYTFHLKSYKNATNIWKQQLEQRKNDAINETVIK